MSLFSKSSFAGVLSIILGLCCLPSGLASQTELETGASQSLDRYNSTIKPILAQFCYECHGHEEQEGDLRIDLLNPNMHDGKHGGKWQEVLDALDRGDMPPEDSKQPSGQQREGLIEWMAGELKRAAALRRSTGGHVTLRRLTRNEYNNTLRDLLGIDLNFARDLLPDTKGADGYKNNGQYMGMSELQLEEYYKAAKQGLTAAIVAGEQPLPIRLHVTEGTKGVRTDDYYLAPFDPELGGTVVSYGKQNPKSDKGANRLNTIFLVCMDKLPLQGSFRVKIRANATEGDPSFSPPRMSVTIGHKTGAKIEPKKTLAEVDVVAQPGEPQLGEPQLFEFTGRLEEYPLHIGKTIKKFPGLRVQITDLNARVPKAESKKKSKTESAESKETTPTIPVLARPALVIYSIEFETPIDQTWPPESHTRIFPPRDDDISDEVYLEQVLKQFITRAFRRPATYDEIKWATRYYHQMRPSFDSQQETIQEVLTLVLMSPKFLYLPEYKSDADNATKVALDSHELASRLSYFLWGTMPDDNLLELAKSRKISSDDILAQQVKRMISDERSWQFVENFGGQWLELDGVDSVAVNPEFFPNFDNSLKEDMKQESLRFFAEILYNQLSCLNFLDSKFVVVNDRLAEFYDMEKPKSGQFQRVDLSDDSIRGGVLTQASFLLGNSTGAEGHPIYRAKWFLDRIMGDPPGDPPADVPELDEEGPDLANLSLKQKLEVHRKRDSCNRCHRRLDPWGIPFEGFNGIGQSIASLPVAKKRSTQKVTTKNGAPLVEDETTLPDGTQIKGSKELRAYLLKNKSEEFATAFCGHLLTFALGRSLEWNDQPLIDRLAKGFQKNEYKLNQLIIDIVQSDAFKTK